MPAEPTPVTKFEHSPLVSAPSPEAPSLEPEQEPSKQSFADPAILSIGKPPDRGLKKTDTFATLTEPFDNLSLEPSWPETSELETTELLPHDPVSLKARRSARSKSSRKQPQDLDTSSPQHAMHPRALGKPSSLDSRRKEPRIRSRKRRQLATEDIGKDDADKHGATENLLGVAETGGLGISETGHSPMENKSALSKRKNKKALENQNGWATEDATDIQELGDFDFAANLSKFDKREIFRQLKEDDTVAESARLVGHNRVSKINNSRGRNLHWTENVLDTPKATNNAMWNSEAGDTADEVPGDPHSGRSSLRELSRSQTRLTSSRKGSMRTVDEVSSLRTASNIGSFRQTSFEISGSPRLKPKKTSSTSPFIGGTSGPRPSLRMQGSNKLCPLLTPLQSLEFEQYAVTELGMTEDMLTENAARGIAETVSRSVENSRDSSNPSPTIVAVMGNHKTGARTLGACRHLRNHGFKVIAAVMSLGREEDLLETVRRQKNAYVKFGGNLVTSNELLDGMKASSIEPVYFIDALFAAHSAFDDLRRNEQAWCFELIILINRTPCKVLSVDVPSGVDASSGEVTVVEQSPLAILPHTIIALGAPKPYLLPMLEHAGVRDDPVMYVADIGISSSVWRRLGHKKSRGIDFGTDWVIGLRYQPAVE